MSDMKGKDEVTDRKPYPYELATPEQCVLGSLWWCIHHEVMLEPLTEPIVNRVTFIRECKANHEVETRLRAMRPAVGSFPEAVVQANAACQQADVACQQADAAWEQANAAYRQASAACQQANAACQQASAACQQANAACQQANAACQQANAAYRQANAAYRQASVAYRQALREHAPEIDALFAVECADVPWGPDGLVFPEKGKP
jgi:hypothetical protein